MFYVIVDYNFFFKLLLYVDIVYINLYCRYE